MLKKIKEVWKTSDPTLKSVAILFLVAILIILFLPYLFTRPNFSGIDFSNTGQIGDTIGGLLGPFVAIIAASLTFLAFWIQYRANQIQITNFNEQRKDIQTERFQNKFYNLISLHKAHVEEINSRNTDQNYFIKTFNELKETYYIVEKFYYSFEIDYPQEIIKGSNSVEDNIFLVAYLTYWFGDSAESRKIIDSMLRKSFPRKFISELFSHYDRTSAAYKGWKETNESGYPLIYQDKKNGRNVKFIESVPFKEHSSTLGHYYRHLFQSIKYIDDIDKDLLNSQGKYEYTKNLRAQLSNHEQLLLYYNCLSPFGKPWLELKNKDILSSYFIKYKIVKNLPLPLASISPRPQERFKKEINSFRQKEKPEELFEWHEITNRI